MTYISGFRSRNWMRYRGEFELALEPGCYAILAEGETNKKRSNYYGKSSFLSALRWGLEGGKVPDYDTIEELISYGEDEFGVDLELSDGTFISREKKRGSSVSLVVQVAGKSLEGDEAQAMIETVIGLTKEERRTTCWSEQDSLAKPIKSTPAILTKTIESWLGEELVKLVEAGDSVAEDLKTASDLHAKAVGFASELERSGSDEAIAALAASVETQRASYDDSVALYNKVQKEREEFGSRVIHRNLLKQAADLKRESSKELPPKRCANTEQGDLRAVDKKLAALENEKSALEEQRGRLQKLVRGEFDGACPVSKGFACPAVVQINSLHEPNRKELARVEADLRKKEKEWSGAKGDRSIKYAALEAAVNQEMARVKAEARLAAMKESLAKVEDDLRFYDGKVPAAEFETIPVSPPAPSDYALKRAEDLLASAKKARQLLDDARRRVEETAAEVRAHRLSLGVLGLEGARRAVLKSTVDRIESKANELFAEAGIDLKVKAVWGRDVGDLADQCPECGRAYPATAKVKRCECGALRGQKFKSEFKWKLNFISGAAWNMGGLVIRCAGFDFLKQKRGTPWSVAVMDEISGSLDEYHRRSISASIRRLLVGTFEQAFITAHDTSSLEACDKRIIVSGGSEWSKIKVA